MKSKGDRIAPCRKPADIAKTEDHPSPYRIRSYATTSLLTFCKTHHCIHIKSKLWYNSYV